MILSSADILRILGGSEIIRLAANLKIVDSKPTLSGSEELYICVSRFPLTSEFEATWVLWLEGDGETDLVIREIRRLLPKTTVEPGLVTTLTTTEFKSENTQAAPEAPAASTAQVDLSGFEERFQGLVEEVEDRMLLVSSGRNGKDGKDGRDGYDGRDGKDIDATQTELFDLKDVQESPLPLEKGQVLTWDGSKWTNLYTRTVTSVSGGGGGGGGSSDVQVLNDLEDVTTEGVIDGQFLQYSASQEQWQTVTVAPGGSGIPEAPMDGNFYVRKDGSWVNLESALKDLGFVADKTIDGGNLTTGESTATDSVTYDGGNFTTGATTAESSDVLDGGLITGGGGGTGINALDATLDGGNFTTGQSSASNVSIDGGDFSEN